MTDTPPLFIEDKIKTNPWVDFLYASYLFAQFTLKSEFLKNRFRGLWRRCSEVYKGPVRTRIHGREAVINPGYTYPFSSRIFPAFNQPLVELVNQSFLVRKAPVAVVDIGAAIGDTPLLLDANFGEKISRFYAVEGDKEFYPYLQHNLKHLSNVTLLKAFLSSNDGQERELVRIHGGTASAQGESFVPSVMLDTLLPAEKCPQLDVIKVDVDGFDGRVLTGSGKLLTAFKPAVIFEWHPILCKKTGNSWAQAFDLLQDCGYETFVFFNKRGDFSHFMMPYDAKSTALLAQACLRNKICNDWHYDVVALHESSQIDPLDLAEMTFAKKRKSRF